MTTATDTARNRAALWVLIWDLWDTLTYIGLMVAMLWAAHDGEVAWVLASGFFLVLRAIEKKDRR